MHARWPLRFDSRSLLAVMVVCATAVLFSTCGEKDYNVREARQAFEAWRGASLSGDADAALAFFQPEMFEQYTRLVTIALAYGKREEICAMSNTDRDLTDIWDRCRR